MTENEISVCHVFTQKNPFSNKLAYIYVDICIFLKFRVLHNKYCCHYVL